MCPCPRPGGGRSTETAAGYRSREPGGDLLRNGHYGKVDVPTRAGREERAVGYDEVLRPVHAAGRVGDCVRVAGGADLGRAGAVVGSLRPLPDELLEGLPIVPLPTPFPGWFDDGSQLGG